MRRNFNWFDATSEYASSLRAPVHASVDTCGRCEFANTELSLSAGGYALVPTGADLIAGGVVVTLEYDHWLDAGFVLEVRALGSFASQRGGFQWVPWAGGQLGLRYLFLEDDVRPYVSVCVSGLGIARDASLGKNAWGGVGAALGIDVFIQDSVSLGLRANADLFVTLNAPVMSLLGGGLNVATYF